MVTDAFDWTMTNVSTPTKMTGPSRDHTGGKGHKQLKNLTQWEEI